MSLTAHPSLPEFDYLRPTTLAEATHFLAQHPDEARPLLGGTDVLVRMRDGIWHDRYLVDVKCLEGMDDISFDPVAGLSIGAGVSMNRVIASVFVQSRYAVLAEAAASCASYQLRNRATVVGNICNASPAGDTIGACILLGGVLDVQGFGGARREPLSTFFLGPGKTRLQPGDIVTGIRFPVPPVGAVGTYLKHGRNRISDLAIVGITVLGWPDSSLSSGFQFGLALASVAPVPLVVHEIDGPMSETQITKDVIAEAANLAMAACDPIDDVRATARYRKLMVRNLSGKALAAVWNRLQA